MSLTKKIALTTCVLLMAAVVGCWELGRRKFPYGHRTCCLPCMVGLLVSYSIEHDDNFPDGTNSYAALQKLWSPSLSGSHEVLAGISGDIDTTSARLKARQPISSNECSWVYFPGLRYDDNRELMLIYERVSGIGFNGRRTSGHAVGFIDGHHSQIPESQWESFLANQNKLRAETLAKRAASTNR